MFVNSLDLIGTQLIQAVTVEIENFAGTDAKLKIFLTEYDNNGDGQADGVWVSVDSREYTFLTDGGELTGLFFCIQNDKTAIARNDNDIDQISSQFLANQIFQAPNSAQINTANGFDLAVGIGAVGQSMGYQTADFLLENVTLADLAGERLGVTTEVLGATNTTAQEIVTVSPLTTALNLSPKFRIGDLTGTFKVNSLGQITADYLFDGGAYEGELAVFSLAGMEYLELGSLAFIQEAARRALSDSTLGRVLVRDQLEGAKFSDSSRNFNQGTYGGTKTFQMTAGDTVGLIWIQDTTLQEIYDNPTKTNQNGKLPLLSINEANLLNKTTPQVVKLDINGTLGFEDIPIGAAIGTDLNYTDLVVNIKGLDSRLPYAYQTPSTNSLWKASAVGQAVLADAAKVKYSAGVFEVGETGGMTFDFLYDGGWFRGELAVFSLTGMEQYQVGSQAFVREAANRALSNSNKGYVLLKDVNEGAKFDFKVSWEANFNSGPYQGIKTFAMTPGDEFAVMMIQNNTVQAIANNVNLIYQWGNAPIFSVPELNLGLSQNASLLDQKAVESVLGQYVQLDGTGTIAMEDIQVNRANSDKDYNDVIFQIKGAFTELIDLEDAINVNRDWRDDTAGKDLLRYANRAQFDQGVFQVGASGTVVIDWLLDGGMYDNAEVGIFSLSGLDQYETGSTQFVKAVLDRVKSNSTLGYRVVSDTTADARYSPSWDWEALFNGDNYLGRQSFAMTPGDQFGFVLLPDASFDSGGLTNWNGNWGRRPFFSMEAANPDRSKQFGEIYPDAGNGLVVGFEDVHMSQGSNRDYQDIVLGIQGATSVNVPLIADIIHKEHNWLTTDAGQFVVNNWG
ncbi:MAG: hypothetical protein RLZZ490_189 [Cyanobacteriota bacterium]